MEEDIKEQESFRVIVQITKRLQIVQVDTKKVCINNRFPPVVQVVEVSLEGIDF